jgi:hypothetical protein
MARPDTRVRITFDLAAGGSGDFFTLNDPVKGILTGGTVTSNFGLAGDILTDVTDDVRSITVRRGRSRELEQYQAGDVTVTLDSRDRKYDPSYVGATFNSPYVLFDDETEQFNGTGSPFGVSMRPRKAVQITTAGKQVFNGLVDDWDIDFALSGDHRAIVKVTDGFTVIAQQLIEPHTATAQATGARINAILNRSEIGWPAARRDIDTGIATLQADNVGGDSNPKPVNALQYLQQVEQAEQGALFIASDGVLRFVDRDGLDTFSGVVFSDQAGGIPFEDIDISFGSEELRNRITVTRLNGGTAVAQNAASISQYGAIDFEIRDSLLANDTQATTLANLILSRYDQPQLRINGVDLTLNALTPAQIDDVMDLELGVLVRVIYTPSDIGTPIDQLVRIDSIEHSVDTAVHRVRLAFSDGRAPSA